MVLNFYWPKLFILYGRIGENMGFYFFLDISRPNVFISLFKGSEYFPFINSSLNLKNFSFFEMNLISSLA